MWLPDPSSIYFALLGGALFGLFATLRHPALRPSGAIIMLGFVAFFFFAPQLLNEFIRGNEGVPQSMSRIFARVAPFIFASAATIAIMRWWKERAYDSLS